MIHKKRFKTRGLSLFLNCLFSATVFLCPRIVQSDRDLTDARKKENIYQMYSEYKKEFPFVKDLSPLDVMKLLKTEQVIFVDVRKPKEMKTSMLPGAVSKKEFLANRTKYKDLTVVAYCTISYRSGKFAIDMEKEGISVYNLKGGILAWVFEGGEVYDARGETKRVHVYGEEWNYLPEGYEPVLFGLFEKYL